MTHSGLIAGAFSALFCVGLAGAPAHADVFLDRLAGTWSGKGVVRTTERSPDEAIRCRLRTTSDSSGGRLSVQGTCSVAGLTLPVTGAITSNGKNYASTVFQNLARLSSTDFNGRLQGSQLKMDFSGRDLQTNQDIRAHLTISTGKDSFNISLSRSDPDSGKLFEAGSIRFTAGFN